MDSTLILASDAGIPDAGNRSWVEVLVTTNGEVVQNGRRKFILTRADLETCAAQIRQYADKLPLDYDHSYVEGGSTVASGWFTGDAVVLAKGQVRPTTDQTVASEEELWAQVEWTPQAAADITSKRFRFISAEFKFSQQVKGVWQQVKEFAAGTLTNRPFFNRMEAVTLSRITTATVVWDVTAGFQHIRDRLAAELNPPDTDGDLSYRYCICDIDVAGLRALVEDSQDATTWVVPFTLDENGDPTPADQQQWVQAEEQWVAAAKAASDSYNGREATTEGAEMDTTVLAKTLGLADNATETEITTALAAAKENADRVADLEAEVEALKNDKSEVETLRQELKVEQTKRIDGERAQIFSTAIRDGRMTPAEQEPLTEAFGDNVEALTKILAARPTNATLAKEQGSAGDAAPDTVVPAHVEKEFDPADGTAVDVESLSDHAKALQILGKDDYTEAEYLAAVKKARRGETVTA